MHGQAEIRGAVVAAPHQETPHQVHREGRQRDGRRHAEPVAQQWRDFARLLDYEPEIVLLGTGDVQRFPHPRLLAPLGEAHVGIEAMDTSAACRTFNILVAEGRRVAAALTVV